MALLHPDFLDLVALPLELMWLLRLLRRWRRCHGTAVGSDAMLPIRAERTCREIHVRCGGRRALTLAKGESS